LATKQIQYEKTQALIAEGDRALELIGRAIRMAGYRNISFGGLRSNTVDTKQFIHVEKKQGIHGSDFLRTHHGFSGQTDYDCIGNPITLDRTKHQMAYQGFMVDRPSISKGVKIQSGSLICQSLDRQGRIQNTTLMNGIDQLKVDEVTFLQSLSGQGQKRYRVQLRLTDGRSLYVTVERTFTTRNLL
jgi:hypothetical protein